MARLNRELLSIGKKINHDGASLEIIKRLKAGLTGEVYEGTLIISDPQNPVHVAIKAMKTLEFPAARQFFLQESETLAFLMHLEEEANREQGLDLKIAPTYYGRGEYQENPYLVMEYIEGKEIPNLLKNLEGGKFPEKQALTVAWHLYRTLDVLHRLLRKSYIDLKFENLWWVSGSEQLKLTDFGTLEEIQTGDIQRRGVLRDILLAAVYFCKMATGYTPNYSLGELKEFRELKKNVQTANISWGAKQELKRLLHRNPAQRPLDASDVAARLRTLVDFWSRDEFKVLEIARKALDRAQIAYDEANTQNKPISEEGLNSAYRARSAFEIIGLRSVDVDISYDKERLYTILKSADHLERGKNLLRGRSYLLAKQVFQEGMEWGEDSATLRRWAYLAEIGEAISPTDFEAIQDKAFTILDECFSKALWEEALGQLKKMQSILDLHQKSVPVGLSSLFSEARLFAEIEKADESFENLNYQDAAQHYRAANDYLENLPDFYRKFIYDNELGDLEASATEMDKKVLRAQEQKVTDADYDQSIEAVKEGKDKEALVLAEKAYRASFTLDYNLERLSEVVCIALGKNNYNLAFDLAQIALLCGSIPKALIEDLNLAKNLNQANQSLDIPDPDQFYECSLYVLESSESHPLTKDCIKDLLYKAERKARHIEDADLYIKVGELSEKIGDIEHASNLKSEAEKIRNKKSGERHAKVNELVAEAKALGVLKPNPFNDYAQERWLSYSLSDTVRVLRTNEERYKYVREILSRAEALAHIDGYFLDNIMQSQNDLLKEIERLSTNSELFDKVRKHKYEDDLFALNYWWMKIEPLLQWRKRSREVFGNSKASQSIYEQLYAETNDFLTACYAVLQGDKTARFVEETTEYFSRAAQGVELVATVERVEIQILIENAHTVLNTLGPEGWFKLKQDAELAIKNSDALLSEASRVFEEGDLPRTQVLLDQSKSSAGERQDWKVLYVKTMRVILWRKWQENQVERLTSLQYHPELLSAIREYVEQKLPLIYWSGSSADMYLKRMGDVLQLSVMSDLSRYKDADFTEVFTKWLDISWTHRMALSNETISPSWNAKAWLDSVYSSVLNRDSSTFAALVHKTPIPEQIDNALANINLNMWSAILHQKEQARRDAEDALQNRKQIAIIASGAIALICIVLVLMAFLYRAPIRQLVYGTFTPTATLTPTITPTFTATPTLSPTPTFMPTPLTPSVYLVPDPKKLYPIIPNAVEAAWIIPPEFAIAEPVITDAAIWTREVSTAPGTENEVFYSTQKAVVLSWTTDQPLPGGWYAIYVMDTKSKSGGFGLQAYDISSNGQHLLPFRGQSSVIFNTEELGQKSDEWLALGVYEIPAGQKIEIKTIVPPLTGKASFTLGKLLIVKITDPQKVLYDALPSERVLFNLSDDTSAIVLNTENMISLSPDYQGLLVIDPNLNSWGGGFRSLAVDSLNGISNKVSIQWHSAGRLPAGKYQLLVWIPANNATAVGEFSMLLNGKPVDKQTLPIINQADHPGRWWAVDIWNVSEEGSVNVLFTVNVAENAGKFIGIDALALVKVE